MEDTLFQIESLRKKFEDREHTTIFENEQIALTIKNLAEDLKSVQAKLANNEILKKYYQAEEGRFYFEEKYRTVMEAINDIEAELEDLRLKIEETPKTVESLRTRMQSEIDFDESEQSDHFLKWRHSSIDSQGVPEDEFNQLKQRLELMENENDILSMDNREFDKTVQELERNVSEYRYRVTRLLSENSEFRRDLEQNYQIKQILSERKNEVERKSKHCSDRLKFYELKNETLEELNKSLYDHIAGLEEELTRIREEKNELEDAFKRKMSELEDHLSSVRNRGSTLHSREQFLSILKNEVEGCYATLTPNKGNVIFVDRNENAVLKAKLKTPERYVEKFPEEYDNMDYTDFNFNQSKKKAIADNSNNSNLNEYKHDESEFPSPIQYRRDTLQVTENVLTLRKQIEEIHVEGIVVRKLSLRENGFSVEPKETLMTRKRKSLESTLIIEKHQLDQLQKPVNRNHKKNCKVFMNSIKGFKEVLENINLNTTSEDDIPTSRQHWFQNANNQDQNKEQEENKDVHMLTPARRTDIASEKTGDYYTRDFTLSSIKKNPNSPKGSKKVEEKALQENPKMLSRACVGCNIF